MKNNSLWDINSADIGIGLISHTMAFGSIVMVTIASAQFPFPNIVFLPDRVKVCGMVNDLTVLWVILSGELSWPNHFMPQLAYINEYWILR